MNKIPKEFDLIEWFKQNYLLLIILFLTLYVLLAFLAPITQKLGYQALSKMIYRGYSTLCHQYAHRSWFLFGQQAYYPLESRGPLLSVYEVFNVSVGHPESTREIIGNASAGYKVAICQRDVALYAALLCFALIYYLSGKKIKQIHLSLWLLLAVFPIGADGLLQLASSSGLFSVIYESTPLMRTITGGMFGFFSGWLLFPAIQQTIDREMKANADPS